MLRGVQKLLDNEATRVGNHRKKVNGKVTEYIYFETAICKVYEEDKIFTTTNGGWNTQSTNRAISDYRRYLTYRGYKEVDIKSFNEAIN